MDRQTLEDAGFSQDQIEALFECFSIRHHHHDIDDIEGLEDALEGCDDEDDEDE